MVQVTPFTGHRLYLNHPFHEVKYHVEHIGCEQGDSAYCSHLQKRFTTDEGDLLISSCDKLLETLFSSNINKLHLKCGNAF